MKGEKKKKSVEKCKGADVKAIPENSIYLSITEIWRGGQRMGDTEVTGGIRQGCMGSPQLFVMVVNMVINSIVESGLGYRDD